jgi:methionine-R-sulfoxide reductase
MYKFLFISLIMISINACAQDKSKYPLRKSDEYYRQHLSKEQYDVTQSKGTERPFCGKFEDNHKDGVYQCVCCNSELFKSDAKFDSGTGWPSFFRPAVAANVEEKPDYSHGMVRTEINCAQCGAHLGHVFDDGPRPTGMRYCLNSASMTFKELKIK